ncbi:polyprenyl synthetase family protein [Streptomyces ipomoeae]|uniref:Polyprenyl synthetase n=1 Tax=Streptomyces ipomoeae 91-03 TaxID=698759 RepID=L1KJV2_9ACTN|nr:polyprenyl synthetase family protein [Streptomyces ipomoeae]EKX60668.1 hypothetical protein STRIP9103_01184 [Streptomyces ipomoeae 91-03]MDX2700067.1 polyprenyl synthetase family protein [Streptomyces ipomoeae]MDX2827648.1 polyprenyl synthetase family protein [Streptomyces ipomoeae]MDX2845697.1 polyprenyl synthetase family protein [Streptomyces ipomoeae]MDX2880205.1 polyprenyl synthetase family protein [Streptomyces ipomoeae]
MLEPTLARICSYHLGFTDEHGDPSSAEGGKLTRAALMMAAADGVGLRPEDVRCQAAALELLHNSTLIHDDIIDADELRRGRPAAWKVFGASLAILAGDALQALGLQMVVDDPGPGRAEISSVFAEALGLVLAGRLASSPSGWVRAPASRSTTESWRRKRPRCWSAHW